MAVLLSHMQVQDAGRRAMQKDCLVPKSGGIEISGNGNRLLVVHCI